MAVPQFRIRTLMVTVAVVGALLSALLSLNDASEFNRMIVFGCAVLLVLLIVVPTATIFIIGLLVTPADRPPPE